MRIHVSIEWFNAAEGGTNILSVIYFLRLFFPLVSGGHFGEGPHYLDILSEAVFAPDPVLTRREVRIFHHCVTVGTPVGKRMDGYFPYFRHDGILSMSFFSPVDPVVRA
jgi:hypothetical protein